MRPEDVPIYEEFIDTLEFDVNDLKKERTLLKIYKEQYWPGNLNLIIDYLNYNVDNRLIESDFAKKRISCGQKCMRTGNCHSCDLALSLASTIRDNKKEL